MRRFPCIGFAAATAAVLSASPAAAEGAAPARECFASRDWQGWSSPSPDVIYLKIRNREVYRVDLAARSNLLNSPGIFLVSTLRGSDRVCGPLDLDLEAADTNGFKTPLFPRAMRRLTSEEVAALPRKHQP